MDRRDFKTNPQQWKLVIDFLEEHPSLVKPNFVNADGDNNKIASLWKELTQRLNAMGFEERNVEKWKAAIGRWRSKTKAKASLLTIEGEKTGGGPSKATPLSDTEERLLQLIGWKTVTGDGNIELGMGPNVQQNTAPSTSSVPPVTAETITSPTKSPPPLVPLGTQGKARKRTRLTSNKSRKMVTVNQMHQETLKELQEIRKSLTVMADTHKTISSDITRLVNHIIDRE